jgi:structural maintenance of chromosome 3 (chondroitin sulfate proteoglycan 6)
MLMKDSERLELLMEVAGCKVYDERREESERIMKDTEQRREKVIEVVEYIESRLEDLGDEKEELKEFQTLDRNKRALEYTIYDQELKNSKSQLQKLDDERAELAEELTKEYSQKSTNEDKVKELEVQVKEAKIEEDSLEKDKQRIGGELRDVSKQKAKLELDIVDGRNQQKSNADRTKTLERALEETRKDLGKAEGALKKIGPKFEAQLEKEGQLQEEIDDVTRRTKELNSKQGRAAEFKSKGERDNYLKKEIATMSDTLTEQQRQAKRLESAINSATKQSGKVAGGMEKAQTELERLKEDIEEAQKEHHGLKTQRDAKQDKRKEMWRSTSFLRVTLALPLPSREPPLLGCVLEPFR